MPPETEEKHGGKWKLMFPILAEWIVMNAYSRKYNFDILRPQKSGDVMTSENGSLLIWGGLKRMEKLFERHNF